MATAATPTQKALLAAVGAVLGSTLVMAGCSAFGTAEASEASRPVSSATPLGGKQGLAPTVVPGVAVPVAGVEVPADAVALPQTGGPGVAPGGPSGEQPSGPPSEHPSGPPTEAPGHHEEDPYEGPKDPHHPPKPIDPPGVPENPGPFPPKPIDPPGVPQNPGPFPPIDPPFEPKPDPIVRDHRGGDEDPATAGGGVVVKDTVPDPIIRDHRDQPIVRDHRDGK